MKEHKNNGTAVLQRKDDKRQEEVSSRGRQGRKTKAPFEEMNPIMTLSFYRSSETYIVHFIPGLFGIN